MKIFRNIYRIVPRFARRHTIGKKNTKRQKKETQNENIVTKSKEKN